MHANKGRIFICAALLLLSAVVVWSATDVTVTKSTSKYATAYYYEVGDLYVGVTLSETNDAYHLTYYVYDYSTYSYIERGMGTIDSDDVTWGSSGVTLDTNTESIAIVGDGGDIELEWEFSPDNATEQSSKATYENALMKQTYFSDRETSMAVVAGTVLGEDFSGTGSLQSTKGKVILHMKNVKDK